MLTFERRMAASPMLDVIEVIQAQTLVSSRHAACGSGAIYISFTRALMLT